MNLTELKEKLKIKEEKVNSKCDIEKIKLIKSMFENENCFFDIDMKLALNILWFLGVKEEELLDSYYELIKPENLKINKERTILDIKKI